MHGEKNSFVSGLAFERPGLAFARIMNHCLLREDPPSRDITNPTSLEATQHYFYERQVKKGLQELQAKYDNVTIRYREAPVRYPRWP